MITKDRYGKLCKEKMVSELLDRFKESPHFVVTTFTGSTVSDLELLRRRLNKISSDYVVVKNSALKVIFEKLKLNDQAANIASGMGISLSSEDIVSTCNVLVTFAKDHDKFKIKSAVIDGKSVTADKVKMLASLPPKNVLLAQVVRGIKAPITGFVGVLAGTLRKFVYVVDAVKTSKEKAAAPQSAQSG